MAVALGICDLAIGTDTAGSGRIPAALNGIVGIKPSLGVVSTDGVVPACASYDCVTIFARDVRTASRATGVMAGGGPTKVAVVSGFDLNASASITLRRPESRSSGLPPT